MEDIEPNYYSGDMEATVPTPPDQQDVSPIDMVSGAVEEMVDIIRGDMGLRDGPFEETGETGETEKAAGNQIEPT